MIIADTGFWLALANRGDRHHTAAAAALAKLRDPLITTWPVMTETCHLLATRLGHVAHERFVDSAARGGLHLVPDRTAAFTAYSRAPRQVP